GARLWLEGTGDGVGHQPRVVAAALDRRAQVLGHDSGFRHSSILPCPEVWFTPEGAESGAELVARTVKGGDIARYGLVLAGLDPLRLGRNRLHPPRLALQLAQQLVRRGLARAHHP